MAKILIVIARLNIGGTSRYIGELVKQVSKHGYEVLVAAGNVQGAEIEDQIVGQIPLRRVRHLGRKVSIVNDLRARNDLRKIIREFDPDLIYSHTFKAGLLTRSLRVRVPIVHAFHGHLLDEPELKGFRVRAVIWAERLLARKAKYLVTVGKRVASELLAVGVGKESQYLSIAPGVRPLKLKERDLAREQIGLIEVTEPVVSWLARVVAVKNPYRATELAAKIPKAKFLLVGGGDLLRDIRIQAPKNMKVLGWRDASSIWAVTDIAVSTSENEGMPVALIEAQLAGIPVVAIDVGSVAEVVKHEETGFVFDKFDERFAQAVERLISDENLRIKMGESAKRHALEAFSIERFTQDHLRLFELVLRD